jgi:2-dehydropantoate 2-reductase
MSKNPEKKKVLMIGMGPTGGIFASHLVHSGFEVACIDVWKEHIKEIKEKCLTVEHLTDLCTTFNDIGTSIDQIKERDFDYVVLAVKTPFMPDVISWLKDLPGDYRVVALQNGIDNEDYLARFFRKNRVLRFAINYAGNIIAPGRIKMTFFHKPNFIGCVCDCHNCQCSRELAERLTSSGLDTEATDDIKKFTWRKTILNASLSPICAILGATMEEVMSYGGTRGMTESVLKEAITVAKASGYDYGDTFLDHCVDYLSTAGPHKPSMLIDVENKNPTEIDYINGKIASYGPRFNIPVPLNSALTEFVRFIDHKNQLEKEKECADR